jgi:FemAB-related protein (PEP-CTERM system-associated)
MSELVTTRNAARACPTVIRPADGDAVHVVGGIPAADWDRYVTQRRLLFHRREWDRVWGVYGLGVHRLAALRGDEVVGVLPLVHQRSLLTGNQLVSLPWFDAAGIAADDDDSSRKLAEAAVDLAEQLRADWVQVRQLTDCALSPHVRTDKVLMRLRLEPTAGTLWDRLKPKVRNQVRKAEKNGLQVTAGGKELLPDFFQVYSENMRDLGSPSHCPRLFAAVAAAFPADVRVYAVRLGQKTVGAGLTMANGTTLEIPWASSLKEYNELCVNHVMYWRVLSDACEAGHETFHFGRSTLGSGQHHFKKQWGAEEVPLHWYFLSRNSEAAAKAAEPPQEKFGRGTRLWQKLPLWASRRIGPRLIAGIP